MSTRTASRSTTGANSRFGTPTWSPAYHRLHSAQERIIRETRRFNVVNCGRRWGKTVLGENRLLYPLAHSCPVGWFAPSYKYLWEVWDWFVSTLRPVIVTASKTEQRIKIYGGGIIDFWSLQDNPDAGRSRKYWRVVVDEAAKVKNLEDAWNKAIRPTLADMRGSADFLSTPKGHDFFWRAHTWGQDPNEHEWASWTVPTISNPYISPEEIEAARKQLPERVFRQEFLAEFIEDAGGVFRNVNDAVDRGRGGNEQPAQGRSYTMGVDLARVEDFTVLCVMDDAGRQVYHERFNQISWERQIASIKAVADRYRATVYLDSTGVGDPIWERLRGTVDVVPYQFTNASKERLIDHLAMQIEQGRVRLMDVPEQTNELLAYQYELTPSRNVRMNAPEGMHDDCVIGLALATWGATGAGHYSAGAF